MAKYNGKDSYLKVGPTELQKGVINFLRSNQISILEGEAGTGKDFCSLYFALNELNSHSVEKIILTKPIVEVGRSMGYLPGKEEEKMENYMSSFIMNGEKIVGREEIRKLINAPKIEFQAINFCRGNTNERAIVILSEAQNCTLHELITFTTRTADSSKLILNGDLLQSDIKNSGFADFIDMLSTLPEVGYMYLGEDYQMRSQLIVDINRKYREYLKIKDNVNRVTS